MASTESSAAIVAPWRIAIDVGGTFTDMVLVDGSGGLRAFKVPTTESRAGSVLDVLTVAAGRVGCSLQELLTGCASFMHGSTVATNVVLEAKGAKVGLLTTRGFRDSLEIRRGIRANAWDHRRPFPPVLVPRYLRLPVSGRIDKAGHVIEPLCERDVIEAGRIFQQENVESVAICLFNSFLNAAHERDVADILRRRFDFRSITLSTETALIMGEYERTSTAVLGAYIAPKILPYLRSLNECLMRQGLAKPILLIQNNGGVTTIDTAAAAPTTLLMSGPAAAVPARRPVASALGTDRLISIEIGGTSCDLLIIDEGEVQTTNEFEIAEYHVSVPAIDFHTVGAGGGTIATVDRGGLLTVGPRGAGARPGPACYGLGGTEATITDAQLLLGRLSPDSLQANGIRLDPALAREIMGVTVGRPFDLSPAQAAAGVVKILEQHLVHALEHVTSQKGCDPRHFVLVASGGAGPMFGASVGRRLGCKAVYIPRLAGAFCAFGMARSDARHDASSFLLAELQQSALPRLQQAFLRVESAVRRKLEDQGFDPGRTTLERYIDLRYQGQLDTIQVEVASDRDLDRDDILRSFEQLHLRRYGHTQPGSKLESVNIRASGIARLDHPPLPSFSPTTDTPTPLARRDVFFTDVEQWLCTPVFDGERLRPGHRLEGPALIAEPTTTVLLGPSDVLSVDAHDNLLIEFR
jgi:N-methylhydantoinase A